MVGDIIEVDALVSRHYSNENYKLLVPQLVLESWVILVNDQ